MHKRFHIYSVFLLCIFLFVKCNKTETSISTVTISGKADSILLANSKDNKQFDSVRRVFEAATNDTMKLETLLNLSRRLSWRQNIVMAPEIISNSKKTGYDIGVYKGYVLLLSYYSRRTKTDSVNYYYDLIKKGLAGNKDLNTEYTAEVFYAESFQLKKDFATSDSLIKSLIDQMEKVGFRKHSVLALAYHVAGKNKHIQFENDIAREYLFKAVQYADSAKDINLLGDVYFQIGECFLMESDYNNSLEAYGKSLDYCERINDKRTMAADLSAIGEIYIYKEDNKKAINYLERSLKLAKEVDYTYQIAYTSSSLGSAQLADSNYAEALRYLKESKKVYESFNKEYHQGEILMNDLNIGVVNLYMGNLDEAEFYLKSVYEKLELLDNPGITCETMTNLAELYYRKGLIDKAADLSVKALAIAKQNTLHMAIQGAYDILSRVNAKKRNFELAYDYYRKYTKLSDSLTNKSQIKLFAELENEIKENQLKAEHDKKEAELNSEKLKKESELKRQRILSYAIGIGFVIMFFFSILIYRSLQDNKKKTKIISEQKKEVEHQKEIIEEKKKEVMDSIAYAKKIQEAILPSEESIKTEFPESFVLYKPKDIVAGDFYWLGQCDQTILIAAADCTGHGVPGAMVSVVCSNALNRAVKEFSLSDPGLILDKVREIVIETFEKSGSEVKDGMDISLLSITRKNGVIESVKWAGANNPLWYISSGQLTEIKADKQPVGKFINNKPFTTQSVPLKMGDTVYLITDGFADQFGGPKGKKFKYKNLKELLIEHNSQPMVDQNAKLTENFAEWKSKLEQVDDVTILGIKI